jgi:hypothetical protein
VTASDLITASLRLIGAIASEETPSASEATDGLSALNMLLGSWSNEHLTVYKVTREEFNLTAGQRLYAMGDTSDFDTVRPIKIERAGIIDQSVSPQTETPIRVATPQEWAAISQKQFGNARPTHVYPEGGYPEINLYFYPIPSANLGVALYSWKPLEEFAALTTVIELPPGYARALKFNLAQDLAPEYGKSVSPEIAAIALESKAAIKRVNHQPRLLQVDSAIRPGRMADIFSGGSR